MIEALVVGALAIAGLFVFGVLGTILAIVCAVVAIPFQLFGLAMKGIGLLIALPFLALGGLVLFLVVGVGALALLAPLLPFVLAIAFFVWLFRKRRPASA